MSPDREDVPARSVAEIPPARRSPAACVRFCLALAVALTADLASKHLAFSNVAATRVLLDRDWLVAHPHLDPIPRHEGVSLLPLGILEARLELNPGAVFGLGRGRQTFFIAFTCAALLAAIVVFARSPASSARLHAAIALVVAGGLGNLHDRVAYARVRDFLHILPDLRLPFGWYWPGTWNPELLPWVFNVADVELLVGVLVAVRCLRSVRLAREAQAALP